MSFPQKMSQELVQLLCSVWLLWDRVCILRRILSPLPPQHSFIPPKLLGLGVDDNI
jgi:hypothetical protein